MSESVKIGGIGKNPAIDRINSLNTIDIKNYAVKKMEQLLAKTDKIGTDKFYTKPVSVNLSEIKKKGKKIGKKSKTFKVPKGENTIKPSQEFKVSNENTTFKQLQGMKHSKADITTAAPESVWEENLYADNHGKIRMAEDTLPSRQNPYYASKRMGTTIERNIGEEVSIQNETAGSIRKLTGEQDNYVQSAGEAITRKPDISSNYGNTTGYRTYLSGKH